MIRNILYYIPIFATTILLQLFFLILELSLYDINYNVSVVLLWIFFLFIPINIVLFIIILVNSKKDKKRKENTNNKVNKNPYRDTLKSYIIEFPFYGVKANDDLEKETYLDGKSAFKWFDDSIVDAINISWNGNNMINSISVKELKQKLYDMQMFICEDGTCRVIISIFEELTEEEKEYLLEFVKKQASNGWEKEDFEFKDKSENCFRVVFWRNDNNWYIKYRNEDISMLLFEKFKDLTEKECYEIELTGENPDIKDNKIGGLPYLPIGEEYPKDKDGNPMALLLQVNLKDIDLENFPKDGILEIFVSLGIMKKFDFNDYCVKYYKDNLEYQKNNIPNIDLNKNYFFVHKSYGINLKKAKCYMSFSDFRFENTIKDIADDIMKNVLHIGYSNEYDIDKTFGSILNKYYDEVGVYTPKICIGGYADFPQDDPRYESTFEDKTECLFKLDSSYDLDRIFVGDAGIIFALISLDDLKNKEFDKTYVNFDCY